MIEDLLMLGAGLVVIYFGGRWTIDGSSQLALRLGVRPYVVGMTIVAFGTSLPELFVGVLSSLQGQGQISLGNVIGSNITNLTLMLGSCAVITPIVAKYSGFRHAAYFLLGSTGLLILLSLDGSLGPGDGLLLLLGFATYIGFMAYDLRRTRPTLLVRAEYQEAVRVTRSPLVNALALGAGLVLLAFGAQTTITAAVELSRALQLSEFVIALSIVALGTNLPELTVSLLGAVRKETDLAFGNALGSTIFNTLIVAGASASVATIAVSAQTLATGMLPMLALTVMLVLIIWRRERLGRKEGVLLILVYLLYLAAIFWLQGG